VSASLPTPVGSVFEVDNTKFRIDFFYPSTPKQMIIRKPADLIDGYAGLLEQFHPLTIMELGICSGGSTALLALLTDPKKLVALEIDAEPVAALTQFIEDRGLGDRVRPYYGVNQADRTRVAKIAQEEFDGEPIDLVIDDASHLLDETRASFEVLYPLVRPGGAYVIEDWSAHHLYADVTARRAGLSVDSPPSRPNRLLEDLGRVLRMDEPARWRPVTQLVIELLLARASSGEAVAELQISEHWIVIRRGPGDLDPASFRVADLYTDHFHQLG
jgi:predicted O-methyltransferase YrrM